MFRVSLLLNLFGIQCRLAEQNTDWAHLDAAFLIP